MQYLLKEVCHCEGSWSEVSQVAGLIPTSSSFQGTPANNARIPPLGPRSFAFFKKESRKNKTKRTNKQYLFPEDDT